MHNKLFLIINLLLLLLLTSTTIPGMVHYNCCPQGFQSIRALGDYKVVGLLSTEQETLDCDDTIKQVAVPQLLFKSFLICALVNHKNGGFALNDYKSGNSCLELARRTSYNIIDASQNPVMITHKDLVHCLLPHIEWPNGSFRNDHPSYLFRLNLSEVKSNLSAWDGNHLWIGFIPCIHNATSVEYEADPTMSYLFEKNKAAIEKQFRKLVPPAPHSLIDLCAQEVAKKLSDEKYHESIKRLPAELYEKVLEQRIT